MGQLLIDFVFLSIKDCKCNLNGSTGCSPSGTCLCKEKYSGSKCQVGGSNSIFKPLSIFWFYALILINGFYVHSVFKEILFPKFVCLDFWVWNIFIFPWILHVLQFFTFIYFLLYKWIKDQERLNLLFFSIKFYLQSQLGHWEIDFTHDALFFECKSIMKLFLLIKELREIWWLFVKGSQRTL